MNDSELTLTWAPRLLSVLRIVTGLLFLEHGTQKLLVVPDAGGRCSGAVVASRRARLAWRSWAVC